MTDLNKLSDLADPTGYHAPTLHEEMLAALRAAEDIVALSRFTGSQRVLRMVQAAILKAEKEQRQSYQAPCGCQQKRHNCDQFNNLPVTVRED